MFAPRGWLKRPGARRMYRTIEQSGLFNAGWYRAQYGASTRGKDPLWHYLDTGWKAGADPSPSFDTSHYQEANDDVRASGMNPLFHYVEHGQDEDRLPVRFLPQALQYFYPDARELPVFMAPSVSRDRVTVLIDSATLRRTDISLAEVLLLCRAHARSKRRTLRIISLLDHPLPLHESVTALFSKDSNVDVIFDTPHASSTHYPVHPGEIFIATSWTSAFALRNTAPDSHLMAVSRANKPRLDPLLPGAWRAWALRDFPIAQLSSPTRDTERISPRNCSVRIAVSANPKTPALHIWLVLAEIETLSLDLARSGLESEVLVYGAHLEPISLLGGMVSYVDPRELSRSERPVDAVVNLGTRPEMLASLAEKATNTVDASLSLLEEQGALRDFLKSLIYLEGQSR